MSDRPAGRGDAFEKLISTRLCVRFARSLQRVVGKSGRSYLQSYLAHLGGHPHRKRVPREGCQNWPLSYNSGIARAILTKYGVCLETKLQCILHS